MKYEYITRLIKTIKIKITQNKILKMYDDFGYVSDIYFVL